MTTLSHTPTTASWLPAVQDFELHTPGQTQGQFWILVILALAVATAAVIWYWRADYAGLDAVDDQQPEHLAALRTSFRQQSPATLRLPADADFHEHRTALRELFERIDEDDRESRQTVTAALGEMRHAIRGALSPVTGLPRLVLWLGELGVLLLVAGVIATSVSVIANALTSTASYPSPSGMLSAVVSAATTGGGVLRDVVGAYPYAADLWSLGFAFLVLAGDTLYQYGFIAGVILIAGATTLLVLDRQLLDDAGGRDARLVRSPTRTLAIILGVALTAWLAGLVFGLLAAGLQALPADGTLAAVLDGGATLASVLGLGASLAVVAAAAYYGRRWLVQRVRTLATPASNDTVDRWLLTYLAIRHVMLSIAALTAWLIPVYLAVILINGNLLTLLAALATARPDVQLLVAAIALIGVGWIVYHARVAWPDLKTALTETTSRTWIRTRLFAHGVPYALIAVGYIITYNLFQSIPLGLLTAILLGVSARLAYAILLRARDRADFFNSDDPAASAIVFQAYRPEDDDGTGHPLLRLNDSVTLAADTPDAVVDAAIPTAEQLATPDEDVEPSLESWHADDLLSLGIVDITRTRDRLDEKIRKQTVTTFRENNRHLQESELEDALADYPESQWRDRLDHWKHRDGIFVQRGDYIRMRRDPWQDFPN